MLVGYSSKLGNLTKIISLQCASQACLPARSQDIFSGGAQMHRQSKGCRFSAEFTPNSRG